MSNQNVTFQDFSILSTNTWIPTFGNWCGPNWSAGQRNTSLTAAQMALYPVAQTPGPDGVYRASPVDTLCKAHDQAYASAQGQPNSASLILQADNALEQGIGGLNWSQLSSTEKTYTSLMATTFAIKLATVDAASAATQAATNNVLQTISAEGGNPVGQTYTDPFGNQMSAGKLANGNLVLSCSQSGNTESATVLGNGAYQFNLQGLSPTNSVLYNEADIYSALRAVSSTITGQGDPCTLNNATITVAAGSTVTINGTNDIINAGAGANLTVSGLWDTVNASSCTVTAAANTIVNIQGGNDVINANWNDNLTATGNYNTVNNGAGDTIAVSGLWDTLNASSCTVTVAANTIVSIQGANDVINANWNDNLTVGGNYNTVNNGVGDAIAVSGLWDTLNASSSTVTAAANTIVSIQGGNDVINANWNDNLTIGGDSNILYNGGGDTIAVAGLNDTLNASNCNVTAAANAIVTIHGDSDITVGLTGDIMTEVGSNDVLKLGTGGTATVTGTSETINASSDHINLGINTVAKINGSGDITVGDISDTVTVNGQYDSVNVFGGAVSFIGDTTGDTVSGNASTTLAQYTVQPVYAQLPSQQVIDTWTTEYMNNFYVTSWEECYSLDPVILNLQGVAVQTQGVADSAAQFDMQNSGQKSKTGWATAGEGILFYDKNHTDTIKSDADFVAGFSAMNDLDTNHDGQLNASDTTWKDLKVWVDQSGTGNFQSSQLFSLDQLGISSINLNPTHLSQNSNGNTILDDSTFTWTAGRTGDIAAVTLAFVPAAGNSVSGSLNSLIAAMGAFAPPVGMQTSPFASNNLLPHAPSLAVRGINTHAMLP